MVEAPKRPSISDRARNLLEGPDNGSVANNLLAFGAFTALDIAESKLYRTVSNWALDGKGRRLEGELHQAVHNRNTHLMEERPEMSDEARTVQFLEDEIRVQAARDNFRHFEAMRGGVEFAEETLSDMGLVDFAHWAMNKYGKPEAHGEYAKETAKTISEYANVYAQVFMGDRWFGFTDKDGNPRKFMGVLMAEKSMNFVNAGNTEAVLRLMGHIPGIGEKIRTFKSASDKFLKISPIVRYANAGIMKLVFGYHIFNSRIKAVDRATALLAAQYVQQAASAVNSEASPAPATE